jgi:hypothetical protein
MVFDLCDSNPILCRAEKIPLANAKKGAGRMDGWMDEDGEAGHDRLSVCMFGITVKFVRV